MLRSKQSRCSCHLLRHLRDLKCNHQLPLIHSSIHLVGANLFQNQHHYWFGLGYSDYLIKLPFLIHYKAFLATMTSADFSRLTFFDQALRSLLLKFPRLNLSARPLRVRHPSLVFHSLPVYRLGFTFVFWTST